MNDNDKSYTFFQKNQKIITDLNSKVRKCKITIKSGYARLVYNSHDVLKIEFYVTNDAAKLSVTYGCLPFGGLRDVAIQSDYLKKESTEKWNSNDWKKYIKKTTDYFLQIIDFSNRLCYCWEDYGSWCVDWRTLALELMSINGIDEAWWIEQANLVGEYNINVFAGYPPTYQNVDAYLKSLSILKMTIDKENKAIIALEEKGKKHTGADIGKALLRSLSPKQKEILQKHIYVGETGDVD